MRSDTDKVRNELIPRLMGIEYYGNRMNLISSKKNKEFSVLDTIKKVIRRIDNEIRCYLWIRPC